MRRVVVLRADRIRKAERFGWVDHRLMLDGYLKRLSRDGQCLYLFLCVAADRCGLSWYSDGRVRDAIGLTAGDLEAARRELVDLDLVAFESPYYQVLSVPLKRQVSQSSVPAGEVATAEDVAQAMDSIRRKLGFGRSSC